MNNYANVNELTEKVLKSQLSIVKTCDYDHFEECGISKDIKVKDQIRQMPRYSNQTGFAGSEANISELYGSNNKGIGIATADGYSYNLFYYPKCSGSKLTDKKGGFIHSRDFLCMNAIYDMNGLKGPNQVGKDIGVVTVFYPDETVQAVSPIWDKDSNTENLKFNDAQSFCNKKKMRLPNTEEVAAISINIKLIDPSRSPNDFILTSNIVDSGYGHKYTRTINLYTSIFYGTNDASPFVCVE